MAQLFKMAQSEKLRLELDKEQQKQISRFYQDMAKDVKKQAKRLQGRENISSILRMQYLKQIEKELNAAFAESEKRIGSIIKGNMLKIAQSVVDDNEKWMAKVGMPKGGALLNVPKDVVEKIITGKVYNGDWSLSSALWKDVKKKQSDINEVAAKGAAQNKSAYDIAKDLEIYVDPMAKKKWDWSKVYPRTNKKIDYNAQRLARTMVSHAYQQSLVDATKKNPFVEGVKWRSAMVPGRTCQLCRDRDGKIFKKDELPLDHPNGLCTYLVVIEDMDSVSGRLASWAKGGDDKGLDKWEEFLKS